MMTATHIPETEAERINLRLAEWRAVLALQLKHYHHADEIARTQAKIDGLRARLAAL